MDARSLASAFLALIAAFAVAAVLVLCIRLAQPGGIVTVYTGRFWHDLVPHLILLGFVALITGLSGVAAALVDGRAGIRGVLVVAWMAALYFGSDPRPRDAKDAPLFVVAAIAVSIGHYFVARSRRRRAERRKLVAVLLEQDGEAD